jgi:hypothetical protein
VTLAATVVVPTHDHGATLLRSVPSALAQTVEDIEVFVIGDGVRPVTHDVIAELTASDERVRFFDNPKGPRHGEVHRHRALAEARGEIICYLSDDDLWLPGHLEQLRGLLADADFAHARALWIDTEGHPRGWRVDLERPFYKDLLLGGENRVPLCAAGHTTELYRRLPAGWRTTPDGVPTDLYMWQQILSVSDCRAVSGPTATALHFPSPDRQGWSDEQRLDELDRWVPRLSDPELGQTLVDGLLDAAALDAIELEESRAEFEETLREVNDHRTRLDAQLREVDAERATLSFRLEQLDARLQETDQELAALRARRLSARLGRALRAVARPRARPEEPQTAAPPRPVPTPEQSPPATGSPDSDRPIDSPARQSDPSTR